MSVQTSCDLYLQAKAALWLSIYMKFKADYFMADVTV